MTDEDNNFKIANGLEPAGASEGLVKDGIQMKPEWWNNKWFEFWELER